MLLLSSRIRCCYYLVLLALWPTFISPIHAAASSPYISRSSSSRSCYNNYGSSSATTRWPLAATSLPQWGGRLAKTGRRCRRLFQQKSTSHQRTTVVTASVNQRFPSAATTVTTRGRVSGVARTPRRPASSSSRKVPDSPIPSIVQPPQDVDEDDNDDESHELGFLGKVVAGTVEIAVVTLIEYATGFFSGYLFGTITDVPRLLFRNAGNHVDPSSSLSSLSRLTRQPPFLMEASHRLARMHGKSMTWATNWGGISASFGGFRAAVKVIRGGGGGGGDDQYMDDDWNSIIANVAAGAFFARNEGPRAMLRSALLYGGLMYMISQASGKRKEPFAYKEQPIAL